MGDDEIRVFYINKHDNQERVTEWITSYGESGDLEYAALESLKRAKAGSHVVVVSGNVPRCFKLVENETLKTYAVALGDNVFKQYDVLSFAEQDNPGSDVYRLTKVSTNHRLVEVDLFTGEGR